MRSAEELTREVEALRERMAGLSAAILRISASLDVDTVLNEIAEAARALTGARYAGITTIDDARHSREFVLSGFTPEQQRQLMHWPDGTRLYEHFRDLPSPVRLPDLHGYVRALGIDADLIPANAFQGAPMRHRGVQVGNFFLGGKEGGREFTDEDEEVLLLFAAQAAAAIANARTHRAEQRARSDLEALVDTSPVGVAVFDARTGAALLVNLEAKRIVEGLLSPGQAPEDLLKAMTVRFADGREIVLDEFPLARALGDAETLRAEEVTFSVPDGRHVTTLVNATPIRSTDGAVESVVVTLQDMAPLEELERRRAEFLGMVSHELRAPLTSIKGSTATVLAAARVLDPAEVRQFFRIIDVQADRMDALISDLLDAGRIDTGTLSVAPLPLEVAAHGGPGQKHVPERRRPAHPSHRPAARPAPGSGRRTAHRPDPEQPPLQRVQALSRVVSHPHRRGARWRSRRNLGLRPRGEAFRRTGCRTCSESTSWAATASPGSGDPAWAWPSARDWWRRTEAASGPRAAGRARERGSPSRSRWPRSSATRPRRAPPGSVPARGGVRKSEPASWLWTTTRRRSDTFGTRSRRRIYAPVVTGDPRELTRLIKTKNPRLVLLDLMLPETDGIELMERISELADLPRHLHLGLQKGGDHRTGSGERRRRLHRQALLADRADPRECRPPCAGGPRPSPSRWGSWSSATSRGASPWTDATCR